MSDKVNAWPVLKQLLGVCGDPGVFLAITLISVLLDKLIDKGVLSPKDLTDMMSFIDNPDLDKAIIAELTKDNK